MFKNWYYQYMTEKMPQELMFMPAQVGRASEDIALQIEAAIIEGKIKPGEKLPSERKLQEQFKTGRGVIREAIRALKEKGFIEIKKGARGGAFILRLDVRNASQSLALFLMQNEIDPDHLSEFRESIDRTITVLAIARASDQQKQELLDETIHLKRCIENSELDMEELAEIDRGLNIRLAKLAGNPVFEWIMNAIQLGFSSNDNILYRDETYRRKTVENWHDTAAHIRTNEPLKALASISNHYGLLRECMKETETEDRSLDEGFWQETDNENTEKTE